MPDHSRSWTGRLGQSLAERWQRWRERQLEISELAACDSSELKRVARDLGIAPRELRELAAAGPGAADLLYERCKALGIDKERLLAVPEIKRDLEKCCSLCDSKQQCAHDLKADPESPEWQDYCPNEATLNALSKAKCH